MDKAIARKWLKQALRDLQMAEKTIAIEGYEISAFLSHQAVEKLFKSLLILQEKSVPKIHKLERLAQLLNLSQRIQDLAYELTEDYALSRYPDISLELPYEEYSKESALSKLDKANEIFELLDEDRKLLEDPHEKI